ncbi:ATP-binding protein [Streptomyces sp. KR55]|uniref:ATP-binding protein n=1 Tax=Streptomyces sp. KR55 TaxID=3457425 RepID=UPI003FD3BE51
MSALSEADRVCGVQQSAVLTLPSQAMLVGAVRVFTAELLQRWRIGGEEQEAAVLIVDEMATNAVQHGRSRMTLLLALEDDMLRISVADSGPRTRFEAPAIDPDEHGRGTGIVEYLADHVEIHPGGDGCLISAWLCVKPHSAGAAEMGPA